MFWTQNKTEAPFMPPEMATITYKAKMVYLALSDYIFNTMAYQAHQHNMLVFNITSKDVSNVMWCYNNLFPKEMTERDKLKWSYYTNF